MLSKKQATTRSYTYAYDALNRLKAAVYTGATGEDFSLSNMAYDQNGNIKTLTRKAGSSTEDDLKYYYAPNTNKLRNVFDAGAASPSTAKRVGYFQDRNPKNEATGYDNNPATDDYAYDNAGNLTKDKNRDITAIVYNVLGLPEQISFGNGSIINYTYTATGDKIKKDGAFLPKAQNTYQQTRLDYLAIGVFANDTLQFIPTAEGRFIPNPPKNGITGGLYEYQTTDHLGNLRVACQCKATGVELTQENHYDPWGVNLADIEFTPQNGNDWWQFNAGSEKNFNPDGSYDYETDFRGYDQTIGRFKSIDLLADMTPGINPFQFGYNNPINFNDPTGLFGDGPGGSAIESSSNRLARTAASNIAQIGKAAGDFTKVWTPVSIGLKVQINGVIKPYVPDLYDKWSESKNIGAEMTWAMADGFHALYQMGTTGGGSPERSHLGGKGYENNDDMMEAQVNGIMVFVPEEFIGEEIISISTKAFGKVGKFAKSAGKVAGVAIKNAGRKVSALLDKIPFEFDMSTLNSGIKLKMKSGSTNHLKMTLPGWKKISIDAEHVLSGHIKGGSRVSPIKTLFPESMKADDVIKAVRDAYKNVHTKLQTQGERVLLRGTSSQGLEIEMWLNIKTKMIESAYPIY